MSAVAGVGVAGDRRGDLLGQPVGAGGDAAADRLADDEHVRVQPPGAGGAAPPGGEGVGLVDHEQGAVPGGELAHALEEARLGQDDPDVGERRLGEHRGDVAVRELALHRLQVVPRRDARGEVEGHGRGDVARAGDRPAVGPGHGEGLVDRAVVAVREHQHLGSSGREPGQAHRPPVGVRRRQREAPQRQPEPAGELGTHPLGVLGGQHRRDPAELDGPARHRRQRRGGGVTGHRAGVPEGEVDVGVPVHVGDPVAPGVVEVEGEAAGPHVHPRHRHPAEEVGGLREQLPAAGMARGVPRLLGRQQRGQAATIDLGHGPRVDPPIPGRKPPPTTESVGLAGGGAKSGWSGAVGLLGWSVMARQRTPRGTATAARGAAAAAALREAGPAAVLVDP